MADSIHSWICAYLIDIGETHGGNLSDAPFCQRKKKVQLVEFLTFPNSADDILCPIYAKVSDKLHKIPVRFTADAIEAYSKKYNGRRITECRNAIVQIKNFRPMFCRVPIGNNVRKQSPDSHLVFEVGFVDVLGSEGEGEFGNPKDIEENEKVLTWTEGLREHGGGGNVLKLRKEQGSGSMPASPARASRIAPRKVITGSPKRTSQTGRKQAESGGKSTETSVAKPGVSAVRHPLELYRREFRRILKDADRVEIGCRPQEVKDRQCDLTFDKDLPVASTSRAASKEPPPPAQCSPKRRGPPKRHALDLDSSQPQMTSPKREQSPLPMPTTPTPSEWPLSPPSPRHPHDVLEMDIDDEHDNEAQPTAATSMSQEVAVSDDGQPTSSSKPSSHLSAPTPAQKPKPLSSLASSSPIKFVSSSAPRPSLQTPSQPPTPPKSSLPIHMRRRVPYPSPPVPPDSEISGFGRILVPNSDTSGQSQSQSQSQARAEQHPSQTNLFPVTPGDVSQAQTNGHLPANDRADDSSYPLVTQPPRGQADDYDGDRSSPELPLQLENDKQRQHLGAAYEAAKARSLPRSPQVNEVFEPEVIEQYEQQEDEEQVDQLQSDGEKSYSAGKRSVVNAEHSPKHDLSDDDAQIHAMLVRNSPQHGEAQKAAPDPAEEAAEVSPTAQPSAQGEVKRGGDSGAIASRHSSVVVSNGSRKRSRAASPVHPLSPTSPLMQQPSKDDGGTPLPEHDAEAWRNPSFMQRAQRGETKAELVVRTTVTTIDGDKSAFRSHITFPIASSNKMTRSRDGSPHRPDAGMAIKADSMKGHGSRANTPAVAGPSRPSKRVRDRLSESSRPSSVVQEDLGSGSRKKRKIEANQPESRTARLGADADVLMGSVKEEPVKQQSRISSVAPTDSGSGNRKKRRIEVEGSGSGASTLASTSVRTVDSGREQTEQLSFPDDEPLLKGFIVDFQYLPQEPGGPRLRTWEDVQKTLLSIGREMRPKVSR